MYTHIYICIPFFDAGLSSDVLAPVAYLSKARAAEQVIY